MLLVNSTLAYRALCVVPWARAPPSAVPKPATFRKCMLMPICILVCVGKVNLACPYMEELGAHECLCV